MTDVTQGRDQDGAELSAAEEQLPGGPKTRFSQPDQPTPPKGGLHQMSCSFNSSLPNHIPPRPGP